MKRILSLLLCLCMLLGSTAFAESTPTDLKPADPAPVAEEPVKEEPVAEEPVKEEPVPEEPVAEEPVAEEPAAEEPAAEEPAAEEPAVEEPAVEEPAAEEPDEEKKDDQEKLIEETPKAPSLDTPEITIDVTDYNKLLVSWPAVTGATSYDVEYKLSSATEWKKTYSSTTSKTLGSLVCGSEYMVRVTAKDGTVAYSLPSTIQRSTPKPLAPTGLTVSAGTMTTVTLTWTKVNGATGYIVKRSVNGGAYSTVRTITSGSTVTFKDSTVAVSNVYYYVVSAYRTDGDSTTEGFESGSVEYRPLPAAPTGIEVNAVNSSTAKITWKAVTGATSYTVYRANSEGGTPVVLTTSATGTSYTDTGLQNGAKYWYTVAANITVGGTLYTGEPGKPTKAGMYPFECKMVAPTDLKADSVRSDYIELSWSVDPMATGYYIYYDDGSVTSYKLEDNIGHFKLEGLTPNTQYDIWLVTYVMTPSEVKSDPSNKLTIWTIPITPTNLKVEIATYTSLKLTWDKDPALVSGDGYEVWRGTSTGNMKLIRTLGVVDTFTDTGLTCGETYYYYIRSFHVVGSSTRNYSVKSATVSRRVTIPGHTAISAVNVSATSIRINWPTGLEGAEGYAIYAKRPEDDTWTLRTKVSGKDKRTAVVTDLQPMVEMEFMMRGYCTVNGKTVYGANSNVVTKAPTPNAPKNLKATLKSESSVTLSWSAVTGILGYHVYAYPGPYTGGTSGMTLVADTKETSVDLTDLQTGVKYTFRVRAYVEVDSERREGYQSDPVECLLRPVKVQDFKLAQLSNGSVRLYWKKHDFESVGERGYFIQYSDDGGATWNELITISDPAIVQYTDTSITAGTNRTYRMCAFVYADGNMVKGIWSAKLNIISKPGKVLDLKAESSGYTSVHLTYTAIVGTSYEIEYSTSSSGPWKKYADHKPSVKNAGYTVGKLTCGTKYYFRIRGHVTNPLDTTQELYGPYSAVVSATPCPVKPTVSALPLLYNGGVRLEWTAVTGATNYEVYYRADGTTNYTKATTTTALKYAFNKLIPGTKYYFRVRAMRTSGGKTVPGEYGAVSYTATVGKPTDVKYSLKDGKLTVTWKAPYKADGYEVWIDGTLVETVTTTKAVLTSGFEPGKTVNLQVRAYYNASPKLFSPYATTSAAICPLVPTLKATKMSTTSIKLTWPANSDASGYIIYRKDTATGYTSEYQKLVGTGLTSFTDSGLTPGKTYYYQIASLAVASDSSEAKSAKSNLVYVTLTPGQVDLTVESLGPTSIHLSWVVVPGADGYIVERSPNGTSNWTVRHTFTSGSSHSYTDNNVTNGTKYYYRVTAYINVSGKKVKGTASSVKNAIPQLTKVTGVTTNGLGYDSVTVKWNAVSGAQSYIVYAHKGSKTAAATKMGTTTGTQLKLTGLTTNTKYFFEVCAVYGGKEGKHSDVTSEVKPYLKKVTVNTAAASGSKAVKLTWSKVNGATGYEILQKVDSTGDYKVVATVAADKLEATIKDQHPGVKQQFKVRAIRKIGTTIVRGEASDVQEVYPTP